MDAIEALTTRTSGGALVGPGPDELEIHTMLSAATRAPDHGRLRPWRFTVVSGNARIRLGGVMANALARRAPGATPAQLEKERSKPLRAPLILVVAAKVDSTSKIPVLEQVLSAGAAAENIMVAAFALGFGCAWKTGDAAYDPDVKAAFGLTPEDSIVGFLYLGRNGTPPPATAPVDLDSLVAKWDDDDMQ